MNSAVMGAVVQHSKKFTFLHAKLIAGLSADLSPGTYDAKFIGVDMNNQGFTTAILPPILY
ncbi:MAG: hypothetical protein ABIN89_12005 [Chitinophagaceae bacterium]